MISENSIRDEKYRGALYAISRILDELPMTVSQRNSINSYLDEMESIFTEANKE